MSMRSLTNFIDGVSWSVLGLVEPPPSPVRGHCGWILNEGRRLFLATSGDFSWPPAETSVGHQWILSHGHGHLIRSLDQIIFGRRVSSRQTSPPATKRNREVPVLQAQLMPSLE